MNQWIYRTLQKFAEEVESRWPVKVIIIHNQTDMQTQGFVQRTYHFYVAPREDQEEAGVISLTDKIRAEAETTFDVLNSPFYLQFGVFDLQPWLTLLAEDPMRDARGMMRFSPNLWQPLVYGKNLMSSIIAEVKGQFGDDIIERLRAERRRWKSRLRARHKREQKKIVREIAEKIIPLNSGEKSAIADFLERIEAIHLNEGRSCFVGLDGSGRPLALVAKWYLEARGHHDVA